MSTIAPEATKFASSQDFSRFSAPKFIQSFNVIEPLGSAVAFPLEVPLLVPFLEAGMSKVIDTHIHNRNNVRKRRVGAITKDKVRNFTYSTVEQEQDRTLKIFVTSDLSGSWMKTEEIPWQHSHS